MFFTQLGRGPVKKSKTRKSSSARRPEPLGIHLRRWVKRAALFLALGATVVAGVVLWSRATVFLYRSPFFKIRSVQIRGLSQELDEDLAAKARLRDLRGRNLVLLNTDSLERRLTSHPRVDYANVVKRYPDTVQILARERRPVALVNAEEFYLVDSDGVLLETVDILSSAQEGLPFITGLNLSGLRLGDSIQEPLFETAVDLLGRARVVSRELYEIIDEMRIDEADGLTLVLRGGMEARLGATDPVGRMPALEQYLREQTRVEAVEYVDLRFEGRIYEQMRER
jgi:cell division septal protein FtsQ